MQDMLFILTKPTLAQVWNLLAGYGGLVSVAQQAFFGIGACAMFAGMIRVGVASGARDPASRLRGSGSWVTAEVTRLIVAQCKGAWRRHRHVPAAIGDVGQRRCGNRSGPVRGAQRGGRRVQCHQLDRVRDLHCGHRRDRRSRGPWWGLWCSARCKRRFRTMAPCLRARS